MKTSSITNIFTLSWKRISTAYNLNKRHSHRGPLNFLHTTTSALQCMLALIHLPIRCLCLVKCPLRMSMIIHGTVTDWTVNAHTSVKVITPALPQSRFAVALVSHSVAQCSPASSPVAACTGEIQAEGFPILACSVFRPTELSVG